MFHSSQLLAERAGFVEFCLKTAGWLKHEEMQCWLLVRWESVLNSPGSGSLLMLIIGFPLDLATTRGSGSLLVLFYCISLDLSPLPAAPAPAWCSPRAVLELRAELSCVFEQVWQLWCQTPTLGDSRWHLLSISCAWRRFQLGELGFGAGAAPRAQTALQMMCSHGKLLLARFCSV